MFGSVFSCCKIFDHDTILPHLRFSWTQMLGSYCHKANTGGVLAEVFGLWWSVTCSSTLNTLSLNDTDHRIGQLGSETCEHVIKAQSNSQTSYFGWHCCNLIFIMWSPATAFAAFAPSVLSQFWGPQDKCLPALLKTLHLEHFLYPAAWHAMGAMQRQTEGHYDSGVVSTPTVLQL